MKNTWDLEKKGFEYIDKDFLLENGVDVDQWADELKVAFTSSTSDSSLKIVTINGSDLFASSPQTQKAYGVFFSHFNNKYSGGLCQIDNNKVAYSANYMLTGDSFRLHFDRHDLTIVIYLTDSPDLPNVMFPLCRPKMIQRVLKGRVMRYVWLLVITWLWPKLIIQPRRGLGIAFLGTENLHGVLPHCNPTRSSDARISVQFGFNFTNRFVPEEYYGA